MFQNRAESPEIARHFGNVRGRMVDFTQDQCSNANASG